MAKIQKGKLYNTFFGNSYLSQGHKNYTGVIGYPTSGIYHNSPADKK